MTRHKFILLFFLILNVQAETVRYTLEQMEQNPSLFLSSINGISINSDKQIVFEGTKEKKPFITCNTIKSVINNIKTFDACPDFSFMHSSEETDAYFTFDSCFRTRPRGSNGVIAELAWERDKFRQNICMKNISNKTEFATSMYDADLCLKKIVLGKKMIKVHKMKSFAGYVKLRIVDAMDNNEYIKGRDYETIFYIVPDTVILDIDPTGSSTIRQSGFKLVTFTQSDNTAELEWAAMFSSRFNEIVDKHDELKKVTELFRLFILLKTGIDKNNLSDYAETGFKEIAETEPSEKFSELIETASPLINEPSRVAFTWLLISGGISFDLSRAVIIRN